MITNATHAELKPQSVSSGLMQAHTNPFSALRFNPFKIHLRNDLLGIGELRFDEAGTVGDTLTANTWVVLSEATDTATADRDVSPAITQQAGIRYRNGWLGWPCTPCISLEMDEFDATFNWRYRVTGRDRFGYPITETSPWYASPATTLNMGTPAAGAFLTLADPGERNDLGDMDSGMRPVPTQRSWTSKCYSYVEKVEFQVDSVPTNYIMRMTAGTFFCFDRCSGVVCLWNSTDTVAQNTVVTWPLWDGSGASVTGAGAQFTVTWGEPSATVDAAVLAMTNWPTSDTVNVLAMDGSAKTESGSEDVFMILAEGVVSSKDHNSPSLASTPGAGTWRLYGHELFDQDNLGIALPVEAIDGPGDGVNDFPDVVAVYVRQLGSSADVPIRSVDFVDADSSTAGFQRTGAEESAGWVTGFNDANWDGDPFPKMSLWCESDRHDALPAGATGTRYAYNRKFLFINDDSLRPKQDEIRTHIPWEDLELTVFARSTAGTGRDTTRDGYYARP